MRITNNIITYNFLTSLNKSLERQNAIQEQLSDGKAIHRPSDNPIKAIRSLRFNSNLTQNEQFTQNLKDAQSWMEITDGAMSDLSSITTRVKELAIKAITPNSSDTYQTIGKEIDELVNQVIQIGNTQLGDRYIFSGQSDKTLPLTRKTINGQEVVVYAGDDKKISMVIQPGITNANSDSVNLTGAEVFGPLVPVDDSGTTVQTVAFLNDLLKIKNELMQKNDALDKRPISKSNLLGGDLTLTGSYTGSGNPDIKISINSVDGTGNVQEIKYSTDYDIETKTGTWTTITSPAPFTIDGITLSFAADPDTKVGDSYEFTPIQTEIPDLNFLSNGGLAIIDAGHAQILQAQTQMGARMSMYEMAGSLMESNNVTITADVAANEDLDVPRAIIDFKTSENVYKAALSVGSRIMPVSLVDFLK